MFSDYIDTIEFLNKIDPEVAKPMQKEFVRQNSNIELIASENIVSPAVMAAMGSVLTNKYAEGYPGKRYYGGCYCVDEVEDIAIERAKQLFGADHANVQAHSGANANMAAYSAVLNYGDKVVGMSLSNGGHLTHGSPVNASGKLYEFHPYGVDQNGFIDYDEVEAVVKKVSPKLLVAGASAYPRKIDFKIMGEIAKRNGVLFLVDMAHIAGLVCAGEHMSPMPYADIVTTTTHKTLRGPRGGLILCKEEFKKAVDSAIFPGNQGGPLMHIIASKAVCFKEALSDEFKQYQKQVVINAKTLAQALINNKINLVSGGTDNHLMLIDLSATEVTGKELEHRLDEVNITANKNSIPNDKQKPFVTSGLRVGTPAVTTRGFKQGEMESIAEYISKTVYDFENSKGSVKNQVKQLCAKFPIYK